MPGGAIGLAIAAVLVIVPLVARHLRPAAKRFGEEMSKWGDDISKLADPEKPQPKAAEEMGPEAAKAAAAKKRRTSANSSAPRPKPKSTRKAKPA